MASGGVRVKGLRELDRALRRADSTLRKELVDALKEAAEPVRVAAEGLAASRIRDVGAGWSKFRTGTRSGVVYVAPRARRRGGSPRPRFGVLLMTRAMLPAVEQEEDEVVRRVEGLLDRIGRDFN